ncbi:MAG: rhomboid family intramembrane serine protease [Pseudomonadota bacterium]
MQGSILAGKVVGAGLPMRQSIVKEARDMNDPHDPAPVNPLPPVVVVLFFVIAIPEAAFSLGARGLIGGADAVGWRLSAVQSYGFNGDIVDWMIANWRFPPEHVVRCVTYLFVNSSFTASLFAIVLMLALGKLVGESMGQLAVIILFLGGGAFGALVFALLLNDPSWLVGGMPGVFALIGGYSFLLWQSLAVRGQQQLQAFNLIAILMGLQLIWGVFFGATTLWVADLAGFAFGFSASIMLMPGGLARVLYYLRRD